MKPNLDPPTLAESTDEPMLRRGIEAARGELPSADRMQLLSTAFAAKIAAAGGSGAGGGDGAASPPADAGLGAAGTSGAASTGAVGAKLAGLAASVLAAGGIWYATRAPAPTPEPKAPLAVPAIVAPSEPAASASVAPAPPDPIPTVSVEDLPELAPSNAPSAAPKSSATPSAGDDMALLRRAQDALASNPGAALSLCGEHQRTFPRSPFALEREVLSIQALVRLGRRSEAESRADRFARAHPSSAYNQRIDAVLGR